MKDPWRILAFLLALVLGLVLLLHAPGKDRPEEADVALIEGAPSANEVTGVSLQSDPNAATVREAVQEGTNGDGLALLVRLLHADGTSAKTGFSLHLPDGRRLSPAMREGVGVLLGIPAGPVEFNIQGNGYYRLLERRTLPSLPTEQEIHLVVERSARIGVKFMTPDGRRLMEVLQERMSVREAFEAAPSLYATRDGVLPILGPKGHHIYRSPQATWLSSQEMVDLTPGLDGMLLLDERPPLILHALLQYRELGAVALETVVDSLEFVIDPERLLKELGSVHVQLRDEVDGSPIANAHPLIDGAASATLHADTTAGRYVANWLPPGAYQLRVRVKDRAELLRNFVLEPGVELDLGEWILRSPATATFHVLDDQGAPVVKSFAKAWANTVLPSLLETQSRTYPCEADAVIRMTGLEPVSHVVAILPPSDAKLGAAAVRLLPSASETTPIEVRLRPGVPVELRASGKDLMRHAVWVLVDGFAPAFGSGYGALPRTVMLTAGEHAWILVDAAGREVRRGAFHIEEGVSELRVEVPLP